MKTNIFKQTLNKIINNMIEEYSQKSKTNLIIGKTILNDILITVSVSNINYILTFKHLKKVFSIK